MKFSRKKSSCALLAALLFVVGPASQLWSAPTGLRSNNSGALSSAVETAKVDPNRATANYYIIVNNDS